MITDKIFRHIDLESAFDDLPVEQRSGLRFYKSPNDKWLPSVTTVTGWSKREFFKEWRETPKTKKSQLDV